MTLIHEDESDFRLLVRSVAQRRRETQETSPVSEHRKYRKRRSDGDMDTNGDLIEPGRFAVIGWQTRDAEEAGEKLPAATPGDAGMLVAGLLRRGFYQIIVNDQRGGS